jgi:hypothetical protein
MRVPAYCPGERSAAAAARILAVDNFGSILATPLYIAYASL